ncbi:MAG: hypothetical protein HZA79_03645 [Sphingobacteriales bacterium]|nr:hypothetical protein [Sphingobacteriales bacterium]
MKQIYQLLFMTVISSIANAQAGNTGLGTSTPGSKLTVNGSFGAAYAAITVTTYAAGENDFYIVWNGAAAGTITLPPSTSGPDRVGRLYFFKNTSDTYNLTIDADGIELIDNSQTIIIHSGETALLVKTSVNNATGATWEIVQIAKTQSPYYLAVAGGSQNFADGSNTQSDFTALEYSTNAGADFNLGTNVWTCPQTGTYRIYVEGQGSPTVPGNQSHAGFSILNNGTPLTTQYFYVSTGPFSSGAVTHIVNLAVGDQITVNVIMCLGCGTGMNSTRRRLEITRL